MHSSRVGFAGIRLQTQCVAAVSVEIDTKTSHFLASHTGSRALRLGYPPTTPQVLLGLSCGVSMEVGWR